MGSTMTDYTYCFQVTINEKDCMDEAKEWFDNMFLGDWFNVSIFNNATKMLNVERQLRDSRVYSFVHSLHCVHYDKMKPKTLEKLKEICYKLVDHVDQQEYNDEDIL